MNATDYHFPPRKKPHRHHYRVPGINKQKTLHIALTIYGTIVFLIFFFVVAVSLSGPTSNYKTTINEKRVFSKYSMRRLIKVGDRTLEDTEWKKALLYKWNESDAAAHRNVVSHHAGEMVKEFVALRVNQEDFNVHFNTCALVSNSGQLLNTGANEAINRAECIIRMNNAPTVNYTEDVGNRTTIRVCSFQVVGNIKKEIYRNDEKADYVLMWGMDNPKRRAWSRLRLRRIANLFPDQKFFSLRNNGEHLAEAVYESETGIDRDKTNSWLSTGWFTMLLALNICDELTVYGLVSEDHCKIHNDTNVPYHYYEGNKFNECDMYNQHEYEFVQGHRYLTEKSVFHRFATLYNVTFRHPEWNLRDYNASRLFSPFLDKWNNKTDENT